MHNGTKEKSWSLSLKNVKFFYKIPKTMVFGEDTTCKSE